jgi:hypothetical protein
MVRAFILDKGTAEYNFNYDLLWELDLDLSPFRADHTWEVFEDALFFNPDYIITLDSNVHDPEQAIPMLAMMPNCDLCIGSRLLPFSDSTKVSSVPSKLFNLVSRSDYSDWTSNFRVYRSELLVSLRKFAYRDNMLVETLGHAHELGAILHEYPIRYTGTDETKLIPTLKTTYQLMRYKSRPVVYETEF